MAKMTTGEAKPWELSTSKTLTTQTTTITITLGTAGKFVDRDIKIQDTITVQSAQDVSITGGAVTATASVKSLQFGTTATTSGYPVTATAAATGTRNALDVAVGQGGWVNSTTKLTSMAQGNSTEATATSTIYIPAAGFTVTGSSVYASKAGYVPQGSASSVLGTVSGTSLKFDGGGLTATATATASTQMVTADTGYTVTFTGGADANWAALTYTNTAGWLTAHTSSGITAATAASSKPRSTITVTIQAAEFKVSGASVYASKAGYVPQGSTSDVLGTVASGAIGATTQLTDTFSNYFTTATTSAGASIGIQTNKSVTTNGYVTTAMNATVTSSFYNIKRGNLANQPSTGVTYTELTAPAILTETSSTVTQTGWLYINPGWFSSTTASTGYKISLDTLIPDDSSKNSIVSGAMLTGYYAYNEKGEKIYGGLSTIAPSSSYYTTTASAGVSASAFGPGFVASTNYVKKGSAKVNTNQSITASVTLNTTLNTQGKYTMEVSGSGAVLGSATAGWVTSVSSANVSVTGSATLDAAEFEVSGPSIYASKGGYVPTGSTADLLTTVALGTISAATSIQQTTDTYFTTVTNSANADMKVTTNKSVTKEGYVTTSQNGTVTTSYYAITKGSLASSTVTGTISANKSTSIAPTVQKASTDSNTYSNATITTVADTSKSYIKLTATATMTTSLSKTGTVSCSSSGWITAGTTAYVTVSTKNGGDVFTDSANYYLEIFDGTYTIS